MSTPLWTSASDAVAAFGSGGCCSWALFCARAAPVEWWELCSAKGSEGG